MQGTSISCQVVISKVLLDLCSVFLKKKIVILLYFLLKNFLNPSTEMYFFFLPGVYCIHVLAWIHGICTILLLMVICIRANGLKIRM